MYLHRIVPEGPVWVPLHTGQACHLQHGYDRSSKCTQDSKLEYYVYYLRITNKSNNFTFFCPNDISHLQTRHLSSWNCILLLSVWKLYFQNLFCDQKTPSAAHWTTHWQRYVAISVSDFNKKILGEITFLCHTSSKLFSFYACLWTLLIEDASCLPPGWSKSLIRTLYI